MMMESGIASVTSTIDMCVRSSCNKFYELVSQMVLKPEINA